MGGIRLLILGFLAVSLVACTSVQQRQNAAISKGVYATRDAIRNGRFDLAQKYNEQTARLVPPPKKPIAAVKPVKIKGQLTVILPSGLNGLPVTFSGSPAWTAAVASDKDLEGQLRGEGKALGGLTRQTDSILIQKQAIVDKATKPKGFFSRLFGVLKWGGIFGIPLLIIGGVLLCVFVPGAIPFITSILGLISKVFNYLLENVEKVIKYLESRVPK